MQGWRSSYISVWAFGDWVGRELGDSNMKGGDLIEGVQCVVMATMPKLDDGARLD